MNSSRVFQLLENADWEGIYERLLAYTVSVAGALRWRGVQGVGSKNGELAKGVSCEDIVNDVIVKTFDRTRRWDPDKGELESWLKWQVKSEVSHCVESAPHRREKDEIIEETADILAISSLDPSLIVLQQEEINEKLSNVYECTSKDPQLEELFAAILDVGSKPQHLAQTLNTTVSDINNRLKRLRRHLISDHPPQRTNHDSKKTT